MTWNEDDDFPRENLDYRSRLLLGEVIRVVEKEGTMTSRVSKER